MQITPHLMKNRCITHYLMSYKLRDQMSEALATSNSESFLQLKIICQHKIPKLLQTTANNLMQLLYRYAHSTDRCVFITKEPNHLPSPEFKMAEHITGVLKQPLGGMQSRVNTRGKTAYRCKASRTSLLNYNMSHTDSHVSSSPVITTFLKKLSSFAPFMPTQNKMFQLTFKWSSAESR